ncbi:MAG: hypothetical protein ACP5NQ_01470 [Vulcanisaeta sp.]
MRSRDRLALDSIIDLSDNLLIIVPPFINSLLSSIIFLIERFKKNLITHITLLTLDSLDELNEVINRYSSILFVDPPIVMKNNKITNSLNGKRIFAISKDDVEWVNADVSLNYSESLPQLIWQLLDDELSRDSLRFLETAVVYESTITPNYDTSSFNGWSTTESLNYPSLPGILRLPLAMALSRTFSPIIPGITGNETEARSLVKTISKRTDIMYRDLSENEVMALIKYLSDFVLRAGLRGEYLDKLLSTFRKWSDSTIDVLESILAMESQLALWEYVGGIMSPVINPQSVKDMDNLITKYISILSNYLGQLIKGSEIIVECNQPLTLIDRLCSIINFFTESRNQVFLLQEKNMQINCVFGEETTDTDLLFKRDNYLISIKGPLQ